MTIAEITKTYAKKLDLIDSEILLSHVIKKSREFVLAHPERVITKIQETNIKKFLTRRAKGEPLAYIVRHKEFYGLDFVVNKHVLVPRPETELIVEQMLDLLRSVLRSKLRNTVIVDVGAGSGNIIVSLAHELKMDAKFYAIDISKDALIIAKKNAKNHGVDKKIKFLHGNLLIPFMESIRNKQKNDYTHADGHRQVYNFIVIANLPYLSKEIYQSAPRDVKKFEPKSALFSAKHGLAHYEKLLKQIKAILMTGDGLLITAFFEISPEQKKPLTKMIKSVFPKANVSFAKDLAGKWRVCKIFL